MYGYETIYNRSMNGVKTVTDGLAIINNGNMTLKNIYADNINSTIITASYLSGTLTTPAQPNVTSLGTLTGLNVNGDSYLDYVNCDDIVQSLNSSLTQSGTGHINQTASFGANLMSAVILNSNANITQSGTGILNQTGGGTNEMKATTITGELKQKGNINQTSGSNTLLDTAIGDITQAGTKVITQTGTGTNILKKTVVNELVVTDSIMVPSNVTIPGATYTDNSVYTGTAVIYQTGTGENILKDTEVIGNLEVSGNFNMTGGAATCSLKTPTITGTTVCAGITQTTGTSVLRGITCNQIDVNSNFDIITSGTGKISQTLSTGTNLMAAITMNNNKDIIFQGTGRVNQSTSTGANIFQASTFNGTITAPKIDLGSGLVEKIILFNNNNKFINLGFAVEASLMRYNVNNTDNHVFSVGNPTGTAYIELCRFNKTGFGNGINVPAYKFHNVGTCMLDGINSFTTSLNGVTPTTFSYLDATSSIQTQLNNVSSTGSTNTASIYALTVKTTDLSYASGVSTFANSLVCQSFSATYGNFSELLTTLKGANFGNSISVNGQMASISAAITGHLSSNTGSFSGNISNAGTFNGTNISLSGNLTVTTGNTNIKALTATTGTFSSSISATTGSFSGIMNALHAILSGNLSAVNGTFSGNVSCAGYTSVSTNTGDINSTGNLSVAGTAIIGGLTTLNGGVNTATASSSTLKGNVVLWGDGTFPTAPSTSQGMSIYMTGGTGYTRLLNHAQGGTGGFQFHTMNATNAPSVIGTLTGIGELTIPNYCNSKGINCSTGLLTYGKRTVTQSSVTHSSTLLIASIFAPQKYTNTVTLNCPISVTIVSPVNGGTNFNFSITGISATILKNGAPFLTQSVTLDRGAFPLPIDEFSKGFTFLSTAVWFYGNASTTFTIPVDANDATYTVTYTASIFNFNCTVNITANTTTSTPLYVNCTRTAGLEGTYKIVSYSEASANYGTVNNGIVETNDIICNGNNNIVKCQLVRNNGVHVNITKSIPDYTNFYNNGGVGTITVGTSSAYSHNDVDICYIIYPDYRLQVWDSTNYTTILCLDYTNNTPYPQCIYTIHQMWGSSCKLWYKGILIV